VLAVASLFQPGISLMASMGSFFATVSMCVSVNTRITGEGRGEVTALMRRASGLMCASRGAR
jgi:hypothetical protein